MDTLLTFLVGAVVTMFFLRGYLKKLTENKGKRPAAAQPVPRRPRLCPHCGKPVE